MDDEKEEPRDLDALLQRIPPFIPPFSFTLHLRYILYIHVQPVPISFRHFTSPN